MGRKKSKRQKSKKGRSDHQLRVTVRVRPLLDHERAAGHQPCADVLDNKVVILGDPKFDEADVLRRGRPADRRYAFDRVYGPAATQQEVYADSHDFLLSGILAGYNATVFAYGATGSGKTHTMLGTSAEPGLMVRTLQDLFHLMHSAGEADHVDYTAKMTYIEIYNETVRDLLVPESPDLDLREDGNGNCVVSGVTALDIQTPDEVMKLLNKGNTRRTQEATAANAASSRSHAVLEVRVQQASRAAGLSAQRKTGRLFLIDLAGSERAAHTLNTGQRMVEGQHINRSLLALGNCINSLSAAKSSTKFVNYRDSKLTRLLKESLGGNCRTMMIAHVSPADWNFDESYNTLNYANRAKNIKTSVHVNEDHVDAKISQYEGIVKDLQGQVIALQKQLKKRRRASSTGRAAEFGRQRSHLKLRSRTEASLSTQLEHEQRLMRQREQELDVMVKLRDARLVLRCWDLSDDRADGNPEPAYVRTARHEITRLQLESDRLEHAKSQISQELRIAVASSDDLGSSLHKSGSPEQRQAVAELHEHHTMRLEAMRLSLSDRVMQQALADRDAAIRRLQEQQAVRDEIIAALRKAQPGQPRSNRVSTLLKRLDSGRQSEAMVVKELQATQALLVGQGKAVSGTRRRGSFRRESSLQASKSPGRFAAEPSDADNQSDAHPQSLGGGAARRRSGTPQWVKDSRHLGGQDLDNTFTVKPLPLARRPTLDFTSSSSDEDTADEVSDRAILPTQRSTHRLSHPHTRPVVSVVAGTSEFTIAEEDPTEDHPVADAGRGASKPRQRQQRQQRPAPEKQREPEAEPERSPYASQYENDTFDSESDGDESRAVSSAASQARPVRRVGPARSPAPRRVAALKGGGRRRGLAPRQAEQRGLVHSRTAVDALPFLSISPYAAQPRRHQGMRHL